MIKSYEPLYTVKEVSEVLKCGINTVYDLIKAGSLPVIKIGQWKVKGIDLEQFIEKCPVKQGCDIEGQTTAIEN